MKIGLHQSRHGFFNIKLRISVYLLIFGMFLSNCSQSNNPNNEFNPSPSPDITATATIIPSLTPTKEPARDEDGNFLPVPEAFKTQDIGGIVNLVEMDAIEDLPIIQAAIEKEFGFKEYEYDLLDIKLIGDKGKGRFVLLIDPSSYPWKQHAIYKMDKNGYYKSIEEEGEIIFFPMIQGENSNGEASWGFDIAGRMLSPVITLDTSTNSVFYTDPVTGETVKIAGEVASIVRADLKDPFLPVNLSVGETVNSDLVGREGLTEDNVGTQVVDEEGLPFKFLQNSEGKKIAVFMDGEWGRYLDIKLVNLEENKDIKIEDVPRVKKVDFSDGSWDRRVRVELSRMGLDGQNMNPDHILYYIHTLPKGELVTFFDFKSVPPEIYAEMQQNWKAQPLLTLFPFLLEMEPDFEILGYTERFSQKSSVDPYNLFNFLMPTSNPETNSKFLKNLKVFEILTAAPRLNVSETEIRRLEQFKENGIYPYLWEIEVYGPNGKAEALLKQLADKGYTSSDISKLLLIQKDGLPRPTLPKK